MTVLAWGAKVTPEFRAKVRSISASIGCAPSHLMACMAFETGRTFAPWVRNPGSSATGLLQFMESTAQGLGTSTAALAGMSAVEQLDYVWSYLRPYTGRLGTLADLYAAILWPAAVGKPDDYVVFADKSAAYAANKGLDVDHDGAVTKKECAAFVERMLVEGLEPGNRSFDELQPAAPIEERTPEVAPLPKEQAMPLPILALISAFGPLLAEMIPQIAKAFDKKSETPAKIEAATKIIDTVVKATGTTNIQAAVELMQQSPEALKTARDAVVTEPTIVGLLEIGGGIEVAREANLAVQNAPQGFWRNPAFWFVMTAVVPPLYGVVGVLLWRMPAPSEQLVTQVVTGILGLAAVAAAYYLGSTQGSMQKTNIIAERAKEQA